MAEIVCPFCNDIATFDKICKCLIRKNCKNSYLIPRLKDFDKKHKDNYEEKYGFYNHSRMESWKLCPELQQNQSVEFGTLNELKNENRHNYIFCGFTKNRNLYKTSKNLPEQNQYINSHDSFKLHFSLKEVYSDDVPTLRSSGNVGPGYKFRNGSNSNKKRQPVSTGISRKQNICETDASSLTDNLSNEICEVSCDKSKDISFSIDKILSKTFPYAFSKKTPLDSKNISDRSDFSKIPNFSTGFTGSYDDVFEKSGVPTVVTTSQKVDTQVISIEENMVPNLKELSATLKVEVTEVGLSERHTDLIKCRNRRFGSGVGHRELDSKLDNHQIQTRENNFVCDGRKSGFHQQCSLLRHSEVSSANNVFVCGCCQKVFSRKDQLEQHKITPFCHNCDKPFSCNVCNKKFSPTSNLNRHYRIHTNPRPFVCDICDKRFKRKNDLKIHYFTHTGQKPYECDICKKRFVKNFCLKSHYRIHTNEKPFACDKCGKRFKWKNCLVTHYRTHTGEKPYRCAECKENFANKSTFKSHFWKHTGRKPYKCTDCGKTFTLNYNLTSHKKRLHM